VLTRIESPSLRENRLPALGQGTYRATVKRIADLSAEDRRDLVSLYLKYYDGSTQSQVLRDLDAKTEALLLSFDGILIGFTTLEVYERQWNDSPIRIVYSGDTVVEREHWGQQTLAFAWIARMGELKREMPRVPLYWFLIVKGHRTYKFLPTFGKSFFPHWAIARDDLKPIADMLATEKFGTDYNPATGIVEFATSHGHLKQEIALPSIEEMGKESVRFFLARNPHYLRGCEMVCLCELETHNMRPLTRRIFSRAAG